MKARGVKAIRLANEIFTEMNKPHYRICPGCGKPTDAVDYGDGDKYGRVWHSQCFKKANK